MKRFFISLFLSFSLLAKAQNTGKQVVDSLLLSIPVAKDDTVKARIYNRLFNELININISQAASYARKGLLHTQRMKWPKGIGTFQDNLGRYYGNIGNYDSAVFYYNASLTTQRKANNKKGMAISYNNLGVAAQNIKGDFTTAADYYFKALHLAQEEKDSISEANTLNNLGAIYLLQKDYVKALEFNKKALRIRELTSDLQQVSLSLQSIGKTYLLLKDSSKAIESFRKGLSIAESNADLIGMAAGWSNISLAYSTDYRAIVDARLKAKQIWDETNPMLTEAIVNLGNLGIIYFDIAIRDSLRKIKYDAVIPKNKIALLKKSDEYLKAAIHLAQQTGDIDNFSFFSGALAEVQEKQGDYKNAYYNYKFFKDTEDSIYSQESKNKIAEAESRRMLELNQLALSNQRKTLWVLLGGIALLFTIGTLLFRQTKARKKANRQLLALNKELDKANQAKARFFALMSHDLRSPVSKLINFLHLQKNDPQLLSPELKEIHSKKITASVEMLLDNMEDMLLWSKSQMEQFTPSFSKVEINKVFSKIKRSFEAYENIQFHFEIENNINLITDENFLVSILQNLIQNAAKALHNTPHAKIECTAIKKAGSIIIYVQDNGPGFPLQFLQQSNADLLVSSSKNGLGLFMIFELANAINAKIHLSNSANGAAATLTFKE